MSEAMILKAKIGVQHVEVRDERDTVIGEFDFIPTDSDLFRRYGEVIDFFNQLSAKGAEFKSDDNGEDFTRWINETSDSIAHQFDFLLGYGNVSEELFAKCGPLTVIESGDFYFEHILEGIGGLIEQVFQRRVDKKLKKVRKATSKYHK